MSIQYNLSVASSLLPAEVLPTITLPDIPSFPGFSLFVRGGHGGAPTSAESAGLTAGIGPRQRRTDIRAAKRLVAAGDDEALEHLPRLLRKEALSLHADVG